MKIALYKPDTFGIFASALCVVHCLATPLLFIAHSCTMHSHESAPLWWRMADYLFLVISFIAVYQSTKTTSKAIMKPVLWISWFGLFFVILNERLGLIVIPEYMIYVTAITLAGFHLYNLKFCQCKTDECCVLKS